jgi:hypothetical protein
MIEKLLNFYFKACAAVIALCVTAVIVAITIEILFQ